MTHKSPRTFGSHRIGAVVIASLLLAGLLPGSALAAVGVTPATGGTAISADTNSSNGSGAWTTLAGPVVNGTSGDLDAGSVTFTIDDAGEFGFNAGSGTTAVTGTGCGTLVVTDITTVAASSTITLTGDSSGTCNVTLSGLQVRPTAAGAAPLETSGITASGLASGGAGTLTVVPGTAILDFTNATIGDQPAGVDFDVQPTVHSEDQYGNDRTGDNITLAIKAGTGAAGAGLDCADNTVDTDGGGDADFTSCDIDEAGTGYILRATLGSSADESNAFNVTAGTATKLVITQQPTIATLADAFPSQPIVDVQDAGGNRVTTDDTTDITLALTTGTGPLTCSGGLTKEVVDGRATFSGCSIAAVGVGKVITATSSPVFTPDTTDPFDVSDRLAFAPNPSSTTAAGIAFAVQPKVEVRAGASAVAVNDDSTVVTLSIKAGTGATGAVLTCDGGLSKTVVNGIATFAGCKIDKISPTSPSNPYTIVATANNLTSAESTNVAITAGPASKLGFTAQPTGGVASQAFPIQPVVAIQDAGGNTVTSGTNSTATITLSLAAGGPAGAVLTCTGGLSKVAVAGVATFAGCAVNTAGTHRLVATASNLAAATTVTAVTGNPFIVTAPGAAITLTTSAPIPPGAQNPVILWGQGFTLTTQFGTNGASKQFQLQGSRDLITWTTITTQTTDANGRATFFYTPVTNLYYRVVFAGTGDLGAANSNQVRTVVRHLGLLRPTNHGSIKTISRNTSIQFTMTARPARPELQVALVSFYLYKRTSGVWRLVSTRNVFIDSAGLARTTWKFASTGDYYVRGQVNPTAYNANSVMTAPERYNVR
jgi:trimeric autotransporter adhesin